MKFNHQLQSAPLVLMVLTILSLTHDTQSLGTIQPSPPQARGITPRQCRTLATFTCSTRTAVANMRQTPIFNSTHVLSGTEGVGQFSCHNMKFRFTDLNSGRKLTTFKFIGPNPPAGHWNFNFTVPRNGQAQQMMDGTRVWAPFSYIVMNGFRIVKHCYGPNNSLLDIIIGVTTPGTPSENDYRISADIMQCLRVQQPLDGYKVTWNSTCNEE